MGDEQLHEIATSMGIKKASSTDRNELVFKIIDTQSVMGLGKTEEKESKRAPKAKATKAPVEKKKPAKKDNEQKNIEKKKPAAADEAKKKRGRPVKAAPETETPAQESPAPKATKTEAPAKKDKKAEKAVNNEGEAAKKKRGRPAKNAQQQSMQPEAAETPAKPEPELFKQDEPQNQQPEPEKQPEQMPEQQPDQAPAAQDEARDQAPRQAMGLASFFNTGTITFKPRTQQEIEDAARNAEEMRRQAAVEAAKATIVIREPSAEKEQPQPQQQQPTGKKNKKKNKQQAQTVKPQDIIDEAFNVEPYNFEGLLVGVGVLEVISDGFGFLRSSDYNYLNSPDDIFVPQNVIKNYGLKTGDVVECLISPPANNKGDKYFRMSEILMINGRTPDFIRDRVPFEHLVPLFPNEKFDIVSHTNPTISQRVVDMFAPIGKGQRGLIVAQPKTGKTLLLKDIANAISENHPETYMIILLIDERPEEVTDMARSVKAEVIASTFDEPADRHVKIADLVLSKAKRLVECGHDVVILLDSITRLARAYNTIAPASGKILSGGVDANALQRPKRFFGAARNIENGGSLTIIATALIETGSKMDEVIFEEFKGTGNMELQLDRKLSNKRIFPAVDVVASSTRRDDLLHDDNTLKRMWIVRRFLNDRTSVEAMEFLKERLERTRNNEEFFLMMQSE